MRGFMGPAKIRRGKDIETVTYTELNKLQRVMVVIFFPKMRGLRTIESILSFIFMGVGNASLKG
jgi:hypothetical protein